MRGHSGLAAGLHDHRPNAVTGSILSVEKPDRHAGCSAATAALTARPET